MRDGLWLSSLERSVRDREIVGANPTSPKGMENKRDE